MSNLVIVTGDYCSGTTLLFTLFRKTGKFCCLYEPLHEKLPEYLIYGLRPSAHDHHFFVDGYFDEFRRRTDVPVTVVALDKFSGVITATVVDGDLIIHIAETSPHGRVAWMVDTGVDGG